MSESLMLAKKRGIGELEKQSMLGAELTPPRTSPKDRQSNDERRISPASVEESVNLVKKKIMDGVEVEVVYDPTVLGYIRIFVKDEVGLGSNLILQGKYGEAIKEAIEKVQHLFSLKPKRYIRDGRLESVFEAG